jgi:glycerate kinase
MSSAMIMRPYTDMPLTVRQGLGDPVADAVTMLTQGTTAKIEASKAEVLAKVAEESRQAKIYAVVGGFAAGFAGAFLYNRFFR